MGYWHTAETKCIVYKRDKRHRCHRRHGRHGHHGRHGCNGRHVREEQDGRHIREEQEEQDGRKNFGKICQISPHSGVLLSIIILLSIISCVLTWLRRCQTLVIL